MVVVCTLLPFLVLQAIKLFWSCWYGSLAKVLKKDKITPSLTHLENNNYEHTQQFLMPVAAATLIFIIDRVKSPPPELFFSNPVGSAPF